MAEKHERKNTGAVWSVPDEEFIQQLVNDAVNLWKNEYIMEKEI